MNKTVITGQFYWGKGYLDSLSHLKNPGYSNGYCLCYKYFLQKKFMIYFQMLDWKKFRIWKTDNSRWTEERKLQCIGFGCRASTGNSIHLHHLNVPPCTAYFWSCMAFSASLLFLTKGIFVEQQNCAINWQFFWKKKKKLSNLNSFAYFTSLLYYPLDEYFHDRKRPLGSPENTGIMN